MFGFTAFPLRLLVCWLALTVPIAVSAQIPASATAEPTAVVIPDDLTREQVRDLVARLSDDTIVGRAFCRLA